MYAIQISVVHKMRKEGVVVNAETLSRLSQYSNRYGEYRFDVNRPPPIDYTLPILGL